MKCHYEILGVESDCSNDDLKKAYRKLALEWHPDKNLDRLSEATETFQLIQQAYEILIDPQERAWYDRHKDDILRGDAEEAYKDNCLNVYQYFNTSCFKGYTDDEKGFYTIYRQVFENIAAEDKPFLEDEEDFAVPSFGYSDSIYEEIVHNFYAYWQSYCTAKSYSWEDQFDLSDARKSGASRPVLRAMEKENKKIRDQNRKARNEEVRELVAFVRKRDKRVIAHKKFSEVKKAEKAKRVEELRKQQILERNKSLENYKESEWMSMSQFEEKFNELESTLDDRFGTAATVENEYDAQQNDLYCPACEKDFRSEKAYKNHENSKKHKENVILLKYLMEEEDNMSKACIASEENSIESNTCHNNADKDHTENDDSSEYLNFSTDECIDESKQLLEELIKSSTKSKRKKKKNKNNSVEHADENGTKNEDTNLNSILEEIKIDDLSEEKLQQLCTGVTHSKGEIESSSKKKTKKPKSNKEPIVSSLKQEDTEKDTEKGSTICEKCNVDYKSRNKLFHHLKESGHAVYKTVDSNSRQNSSSGSSKKHKKKS